MLQIKSKNYSPEMRSFGFLKKFYDSSQILWKLYDFFWQGKILCFFMILCRVRPMPVALIYLRVKLNSDPVVLIMTSHFDSKILPLNTLTFTAFSCWGVSLESSPLRKMLPTTFPNFSCKALRMNEKSLQKRGSFWVNHAVEMLHITPIFSRIHFLGLVFGYSICNLFDYHNSFRK